MSIIKYDKPVKDLIAGLNKTGHVTHKSYKKTSVTLHHNGGRLSHEGVLRVWQTRPASAHFDVDAKGAVAQYVKVNEYAWATGNTVGNATSISIEMCNETTAPNWVVTDTTWQAAAELAGWLFAKVIGERPSKDNFFMHSKWKATVCAGPSVKKAWPKILKAAQVRYDELMAAPKPTPAPPRDPGHVSRDEPRKPLASKVKAFQKLLEMDQDGKWGLKTDVRARRMRAMGLAKLGYPRRIPSAIKVEDVQAVIDTKVDGDWGPKSQLALERWVMDFQELMGLKRDASWGPKTDAAFLAFRKAEFQNF